LICKQDLPAAHERRLATTLVRLTSLRLTASAVSLAVELDFISVSARRYPTGANRSRHQGEAGNRNEDKDH
jgi:hypothetical protein